MKNINYRIFILLFLVTISCIQKEEADVKKSIKNIIERFPQLKTNKDKFGNDYKFVKSVKNGKFNFEIQLFSEPDSIKGSQEIIVFVNSKKECYAIPFFSNKYKDYWEFPFDKQIPNVQKINSTFTLELNNALNKLTAKEKDKENIKYEITNDLLYSILNCQNLEERDSTLVYRTMYPNSDLPNEDYDESHIRLKKNYSLMLKEWHPEENIINYNCYLDRKNYRIYQLNYYNKPKFKVKTYRQDWGFTPLSL
ncbi:hypothetical protein J2Y38_002478 [Flavobacterium sp. 2755]|uniref:hypothetical protein n=1 Tax=Flavobacterium sp. 2755 TaxID=2817765 RepID=UPI00285E925C|nr:hypothetical protein [Flavobacterium sp. 2755]MDR6762267.1 hypothetical protein [Flavobacterium sp. 2755]